MAKLALNAFATGPFVCALTSCANDSYCSFRPANAFAASIATLPSSPVTLPSAFGDRARGDRDEDDVGVRRVAAVAPERLDIVARLPP